MTDAIDELVSKTLKGIDEVDLRKLVSFAVQETAITIFAELATFCQPNPVARMDMCLDYKGWLEFKKKWGVTK